MWEGKEKPHRQPLISGRGDGGEMLLLLFLTQIILGFTVYNFSEGPGGVELQLPIALSNWVTHSSLSAFSPI